MHWVRPTREPFPDLQIPHKPANAQLFDAVMVVVSQELNKKRTVLNES